MCYRNGYGYSCDCRNHGDRCIEYVLGKEIQQMMEAAENICEILGCTVFDRRQTNGEQLVLMIAVTPGEPLRLITEDEAGESLPCFDEDDVIAVAPDLPLTISYDQRLVFTVGDQKYLDGPALVYALNDDGDVVPVTAEDIFRVQQMLERRTVYVTEEEDTMPVIALN